MIRIVTNKKIDMSDDEWRIYQKIIQSYTNVTGNGEMLFFDLFETDDNGIILYLKPPSKYHTSLEVFLFLVSVYQQQHIRLMYDRVEDICSQVMAKMAEIDEKLASLPLKNKK